MYLAVNSNHYNTVADTKAVADKYHITYPTLMDSEGTIARAYHAKTSPDMYVISKTGDIVYQGALDSNTEVDTSGEATATPYVEQAFTAALQGKIPATTKTKPYGCGLKIKALQ